jgi:hypothetical protein
MPIQSNHAFMVAATPGAAGISRWLAPELINPPRKKGHRQPAGTEQADIFAFAMLAVEVFTERLPFGDVRHETAILMIARGQRPEKPQGAENSGFTPEIWRFIQRCWHQNPAKRPDIKAVVTAWREFESQERCVTRPAARHRLLTLNRLSKLRKSTPAADGIYQEKQQSQIYKPYAKSNGEPFSFLNSFGLAFDTHLDRQKRRRFCGLF